MEPDQGEEVSMLPMFTTEYRGYEFTIDFTKHQNGITARLKVGDLPWRNDSDHSWPTYEEAKSAKTAEARKVIDGWVK